MKHEISLSTFSLQRLFSDEQVLEIVKASGAEAMDWDLLYYTDSLYHRSEDEICSYFSGLRRKADVLGLRFAQTHGRITGYHNDPEFDARCLEAGRLDVLVSEILGAPYCVVHSVSSVFFGADADPDFMRRLNIRMFEDFLGFAKGKKLKLATETFGSAGSATPQGGEPPIDFFGNAEEFLRSYREISAACGKENFAICLDSGHTNVASHYPGQPSPAELIRKAGKALEVLHLHDNDRWSDQHKCPRTGNIDWFNLLDALEEIGYTGDYNMEITLDQYGKNPEMVIAYTNFCVAMMKNLLSEHRKRQ